MLAIAADAISLILLCQGIVNAENYDLLNATHKIWNAGLRRQIIHGSFALNLARCGR